LTAQRPHLSASAFYRRRHDALLESIFAAQHSSVWAIFSIASAVIFVSKGIAEYFGVTEIQYVGHAPSPTSATRSTLKSFVSRLILPHNPADAFCRSGQRHRETASRSPNISPIYFKKASKRLIVFLVVMFTSIEDEPGVGVVLPLVRTSVGKFGRKIRHSSERSQSRLGESAKSWQETGDRQSRRESLRNGGFRDSKFRDASRRLLRESMRWVRAAVATRR